MNTGGFDNLVRQTANRLGLDIHRYRPEASDMGRLSLMLANQNIDLVFDIGANTGQFAKSLRRAGYANRLVSFEPLSTAHAQLLRASRGDSQWDIAPRVAIGDHDGEIEMHIAGNSVSSSALQMLDDHATAAPDSAYVDNERVRLTRLDAAASSYMRPGTRLFVKIDTQGYEDRVLDGATDVLDNAIGLQLELSLIPLYQGQQLFDALARRVRKLGYSVWAICPGFCDPRTGRMLQVDATFFRD
jgi:FkbM family methyltransferase